jgi:L-iditol 2-dehydrogenase
MRAALLEAPGRVVLHEVEPPALRPDELLIAVEACGVCSSEVDLYLGRNPWAQYPVRLGHEVTGRVLAAGEAAGQNWIGRRVCAVTAQGGCAEQVATAASGCVPLPENLAPELALLEPLGCAVNSYWAIAPPPGAGIVVLGCGFMGLLLLQLLARLAAPRWLLAVARSPYSLRRALHHGATAACALEQVHERVAALSGGTGADITVEVTGAEQPLAWAASLTREEGTLALVGYHQGFGRQVPVHEWNWKALRLVNCHFRNPAQIMDGARRALHLLQSGVLDVAPLLTHRFSLDEAAQAYAVAAARPPDFVKATILP